MQELVSEKKASERGTLSLLGPLRALAMLALCGCDGFPNDIAGTMERVTGSGVMHAGIIADGAAEADEELLVERIGTAAGAEAQTESGSAEVLLHKLEEGELDIVVGEFAKASPWSGRVALTAAPQAEWEPAKHEPVLRAAVRNGENRWLMFVSRTIGGDA